MTNQRRNGGLDAIRLSAAGLVLLSHLFVVTGTSPDATVVVAGPLGVTLFFALSGYLIPTVWRAGPDVGYWVRRAGRIMPGYWFAVVGLGLFAGTSIDWSHLLMLQPQPDISGDGVSGVVWTLRVEVLFYALVPLLVRLPVWALALGATVSLVASLNAPPGAYEFVGFHLWRFLPGLLIARWIPRPLPLVVGLLGASLLVVEWILPSGQVLGAAGAALLVAVAVSRPFVVPRWVTYGATISYGIYLWHQGILWSLERVGLPAVLMVVVGVALTLAAAAASWHLIEGPANRAAGRFAALARRWAVSGRPVSREYGPGSSDAAPG